MVKLVFNICMQRSRCFSKSEYGSKASQDASKTSHRTSKASQYSFQTIVDGSKLVRDTSKTRHGASKASQDSSTTL